VFLPGHDIDLIFQHAQGADYARTGFPGLDHVVHEAALGGDERIREALAKLALSFERLKRQDNPPAPEKEWLDSNYE